VIVDAHSHVGVEIAGFDEGPNIYGVRTAGVEAYLAGYAHNGVDACYAFASQAFRMESLARAENEALAKVGEAYPSDSKIDSSPIHPKHQRTPIPPSPAHVVYSNSMRTTRPHGKTFVESLLRSS
jgi:hypothetical protein